MARETGIAPMRALQDLMSAEPFRALQHRMNRLFEESMRPGSFRSEENLSLDVWVPPCDVYETENHIVVKAELPGVEKEDLKINIQNNTLTITGEHKLEKDAKRENYHRIERNYGRFMRSFILPSTVDATKAEAEFKNGVLEITLPKREEAKPKSVEIKVA